MASQDRRMLETSARLLRLLSLLQAGATGPVPSWHPARRHHPHQSAMTWAGCGDSAIRSTAAGGGRRLTGSRGAVPCRRCCSTTRRR